MKNFEETYEKWRKMLLRTNIYLALFLFVIEVSMYFLFQKSNLETPPISDYFVYFVTVPTASNFLAILIGFIMLKRLSPDSKLINYIPSIQLAFICLVVASTHCIFSVTLCIFCGPIFMTIIFSDKKITRHVGILCFIFLVLALLSRKYSLYRIENDRYFYLDAIVAFGILLSTSRICHVMIKFQEEKSNAIHQGYLYHLQMQDQLNRDQKTGLYGYTIFMNTLDRMIKSSESSNNPIALAVIDIDNFKDINDTYGHLKADQVLLALTELMKKNCRSNQFMARFGGEEFSIIFTESEVNSAFDFLERLRIAFEKQKYSFANETVTISIGMAIWQSGWTSEQLFDHADAAMYASKASGKNRTIIYG